MNNQLLASNRLGSNAASTILLVAMFTLTSWLASPKACANEWHDTLVQKLRATGVQDISDYNGGIWAKYRQATFFISPLELIPDWTHQYWTIVKILSEKYGCFMTSKLHIGERVSFRCHDKRAVVFQVVKKNTFIYLRGHQYDSWGNLLHVKNHEVIERTPIEDQWGD